MSAGILCAKQINELISPQGPERLRISRPQDECFDKLAPHEAAIDLPLGNYFWEMKGSCRTGKEYNVGDLVNRHSEGGKRHLDDEGVVLEKRKVYLFKADCDLDLTNTMIEGKTTGRSSIGRLDVLVRLLVDNSDSFDYVKGGKKHQLYVEVTPISFDLKVKRGTALSQLRLFKGREEDISLTKGELIHEECGDFPILGEKGTPARHLCEEDPSDIWIPFRLDISPDPVTGFSAFVAKEGEGGEKLPPIDPDRKDEYNPREYWDSIEAENDTIELQPDRLYILRSKERLKIPGHLGLECKSYTTEMGEWRIEYAGFAHPYFGAQRKDCEGAPIMFEVRGHNVPTILTDGIPLGNVRFLRMSQVPEKPTEEGSYEKQELTLSKCFKRWPKE